MLNHKSTRFLFLCMVVSLLSSAQARMVPVAITGRVTDVQEMISPPPPPGYVHPPPPEWNPNPLDGRVQVGDVITGVYIYDSSAPNSYVDDQSSSSWQSVLEGWGQYEYDAPPYGITLFAGDLVFMTDPEDVDFQIIVANDACARPPVCFDKYTVTSHSNLSLSGGPMVETIEIIANGGLDVLSSVGLPTPPPRVDEWNSFRIYIAGSTQMGHPFSIHGEVSSIAVVPEPSTLVLLCTGGLVFHATHRRQRKYDK